VKKRLHELPRESPLRVIADGVVTDATFHHLDGMYSLCKLEDGRLFHLRYDTPLKEVDGRWEIDEDVQ